MKMTKFCLLLLFNLFITQVSISQEMISSDTIYITDSFYVVNNNCYHSIYDLCDKVKEKVSLNVVVQDNTPITRVDSLLNSNLNVYFGFSFIYSDTLQFHMIDKTRNNIYVKRGFEKKITLPLCGYNDINDKSFSKKEEETKNHLISLFKKSNKLSIRNDTILYNNIVCNDSIITIIKENKSDTLGLALLPINNFKDYVDLQLFLIRIFGFKDFSELRKKLSFFRIFPSDYRLWIEE